MHCQQLIDDFLRDYVDDTLTFGERLRLRIHLAHCRHCRRYLDSYRQAVTLARASAASDPTAPRDIPDELVTAILAARHTRE